MSRPFAERIYPGETPRPTVETVRLENDNFVFAATPWGNKDAFKEVSAAFGEYLSASMMDHEATSPFAKVSSLSALGNSIRAATIFANERAFKKFNQDVLSSGCEGVALAIQGSEVCWARVGQPHLMVVRDGKIIPLDVAADLGVDYMSVVPLPSRLLGVESQIDVEVKSLSLRPGDKFVMLARSILPGSVFGLSVAGKSSQEIMESLFNAAVADDEKMPFWIAILN